MYREASSTGTANAPADQDNQKYHHEQQQKEEEEENHKLRFADGTEGAMRSPAVESSSSSSSSSSSTAENNVVLQYEALRNWHRINIYDDAEEATANNIMIVLEEKKEEADLGGKKRSGKPSR